MTSDSTELTFVRCPSCRSLVPATSTHCRMCGATLEASGGTDADAASARSGRVRQRTTSEGTGTEEDLAAKMQALRGGAPEESASQADPLSQYIEEIEARHLTEKPAKASNGHSHTEPEEVALHEPTEEEALSTDYEEAIPAGEDDDDFDDFEDEFEELEQLLAEEEEALARNDAIALSGPADEVSDGEPLGEEPLEEVVPPEPKPVVRREPMSAESGSYRPLEFTARAEGAKRGSKEDARESADNVRANAAPSQSAPKATKSSVGRLVGWLASFTDPKGTSLELREGRYFITSQSLRKSEIVIPHETISAPHALISVKQSGLEIQDLMSDYGVSVSPSAGEAWHRCDDCVTLESGSRVRFGEVEYLVVLIGEGA